MTSVSVMGQTSKYVKEKLDIIIAVKTYNLNILPFCRHEVSKCIILYDDFENFVI